MKQLIFISLCVALFYMSKTNAQICGSPVAGPIIQQVTEKINYNDGLFWSTDKLYYVNRYDPHICCLLTNGSNSCTKLKELNEISSIYSIKDSPHKFILFADKKVILLNVTKVGEHIKNYNMDVITTITSDPLAKLVQSVTDNKGRTIIGSHCKKSNEEIYSNVYIIDANYGTTELIPKYKINQISGIVLSSDYKCLFIADSKTNVVYKYDYNDRKGVVGKREVVFNKTDYYKTPAYISTLGITKDNKLIITMAQSGMIKLYDWKKKKTLQLMKIPSTFPTSVCYGGEKLDVMFVGTAKENALVEPGSGAIYAISGTGTVGFQQNMLHLPKGQQKTHTIFKNAYYLTEADLNNMAIMDESLSA